MVKLPDGFVAYFGTQGRAGHDLVPLSHWIYDSGGEWAAFFDGEVVWKKLSYDSLRLIHINGLTIIGYPRSLDDNRGGSKSLFIVNGEHDVDYMIEKMKEYPDIYAIFEKLTDIYLRKK